MNSGIMLSDLKFYIFKCILPCKYPTKFPFFTQDFVSVLCLAYWLIRRRSFLAARRVARRLYDSCTKLLVVLACCLCPCNTISGETLQIEQKHICSSWCKSFLMSMQVYASLFFFIVVLVLLLAVVLAPKYAFVY
jgi:hypothetical protein